MALKHISNAAYTLEFVAGDTEYVRLNIRDQDENIIDLSQGFTCTMGIKRRVLDENFIIPEKNGTMYAYSEYEQPYSIEFKFTDTETLNILNYNGKVRKKLTLHYDIELVEDVNGENIRTTILSGILEIKRSIGGKV